MKRGIRQGLIWTIIVSAVLIMNFLPCIAEEESPLDMDADWVDMIILGRATAVKKEYSGTLYALKAEKILKRGKLPSREISAYCYPLDALPFHRCPVQGQSNIIFIYKSGQDSYIRRVEPTEKEAEIVALLKEQERIRQQGTSEEGRLGPFIDKICEVLKKDDFAAFKELLVATAAVDGRIIDDQLAVKIFADLKALNLEHDYHKVFLHTLKQQRYRIFKGIFSLGGHEYGYTELELKRQGDNWFIAGINHCR